MRHSILRVTIILMISSSWLTIFPQSPSVKAVDEIDMLFRNHEMVEFAYPVKTPGWIKFRTDKELDPQSMFTEHKQAYGLGADDRMIETRVSQDEIGMTHHRYQQYYKDVRIVGAEFILHSDHLGRCTSGNGDLTQNMNHSAVPKINEGQALSFALNHADGNQFSWLDPAQETLLQLQENDPQATNFPKGELVFHRVDLNEELLPSNIQLAWKFDVRVGLSGESRRIYVSAGDGKLLNYIPISMSCDIGTGNTTWYGNRTIMTDLEFPVYVLRDDCATSELRTLNLNNSFDLMNVSQFVDVDNAWTTPNTMAGVTTHWAMNRVKEYYANVHSRNGWSGYGSTWTAYVNAIGLGGPENAAWGSILNCATFGPGLTSSANDDFNTLDIVGHEFTHGVVQESADLNYSGESGALNESFADIFGEMTEKYALGTNDWLVSAEIGTMRSFIDPKSSGKHYICGTCTTTCQAIGQPNTYMGAYWYNTSGGCDASGVHINSGVQNYWFYLLSEGGSGTNDNGDQYVVSGIGAYKASLIAYRNLTEYLTSYSDFLDAREGALQAADDLYGSCSNEFIQTGNAWFAVGVGASLFNHDRTVCGNVNSGSYEAINSVSGGIGCNTNVIANIGDVEFSAANYISFGDQFSATASGANRFSAFISPCNIGLYKNGPYDNEEFDYANQSTEDELAPRFAHNQFTFSVFPNPFDNSLTVEFELPHSGDVSIFLYNSVGKEISRWEKKVNNSDSEKHASQLDVAHLAPGAYYITVISGGQRQTEKVMKL